MELADEGAQPLPPTVAIHPPRSPPEVREPTVTTVTPFTRAAAARTAAAVRTDYPRTTREVRHGVSLDAPRCTGLHEPGDACRLCIRQLLRGCIKAYS